MSDAEQESQGLQESRSFTPLGTRLDALEAEIRQQVPSVGDVLSIPRGPQEDEWSMIEVVVLQQRGVDVGQGRPSWASVRVTRLGVTGNFADFGATVENAVRLLKHQLAEAFTPGQLAATAIMVEARTVRPVPPSREGEEGKPGPGLASAVQTSSETAGTTDDSAIRQFEKPSLSDVLKPPGTQNAPEPSTPSTPPTGSSKAGDA